MSNEFIARKGLVSLRSSSFAETLVVTGSLISPSIAQLTSSWAQSASHVDVNLVGETASIANTLVKRDSNAMIGTDAILLDTTYTPTGHTVGQLSWNATEGTIDVFTNSPNVTIQVGKEMVFSARNNTGATIPNGTPVYISGSLGSHLLIGMAYDDGNDAARVYVGLTTEDIADNTTGFVTTRGEVHDINTSMFQAGDTLYLGPTPGTYTNVYPSGDPHISRVGYVTYAHSQHGIIYVSPDSWGPWQISGSNISVNAITASVAIIPSITGSLNGTASYSLQAQTASYVAQTGYMLSMATSSQTLTATNSFKEIVLDTDLNLTGWARTAGTGQLRCLQTAKYEMVSEVRLEKSAGGTAIGASRLTLNGLEVSGSYHGETITTNAVGQTLISKAIATITSGSILRTEFAASATTVRVNTMPVIGTPVVNYSTKVTISQV